MKKFGIISVCLVSFLFMGFAYTKLRGFQQSCSLKFPATVTASGFTMDYTDPGSGLQLPEAWIQIRYINYVPNSSCSVEADAYKDFSSFQSGMSPIFQNVAPQSVYGDSNWIAYFDVSVMDQENCDIQAMSLLYLQNTLE